MKLVWTKKATIRLEEILEYIESEFGKTARDQVRTRIMEFTLLLTEFPEIGTVEVKEKGIRGFQISTQTRLFYRLTADRITILTLFDSRQNPHKRPR